MKKQASVLIALLFGAFSCHKSATITYPSCTTSANTITITDAGNTYCAGGAGLPDFNLQTAAYLGENVSVAYMQADTNTSLYIEVAGASFDLYMGQCVGPLSGIGSYNLPLLDSGANLYNELFSGGKSYKISGGTFNVTHLDSNNVSATFTLDIFNSTEIKSISGTINANHPKILH